MYSHEKNYERVRLLIGPDGAVNGDDGAGGALAAEIRYAVRIGIRLGALAALGDLRWLTSWGGLAISAQTTSTAEGMTIAADVVTAPLWELGAASAARDHVPTEAALTSAMLQLSADWAVLVAPDGELGPHAGAHPVADPASDFGTCAVSILETIPAAFRDIGLVFHFEGGQLLLAEAADGAVLIGGEKFEPDLARSALERLRGDVLV